MVDFKVMFGNRIYIGIGATIIGLFTVLSMLGLVIEADGDKNCGFNCTSYFNVTNRNYRSIYIYNYDEIKMQFSPEIESYELYVKYYGKWRYTNFTMSTRLGNIPEDRKYVFVFPSYSTKEFKLVGHKNNPYDIIKWGFGVGKEYLDPIWYGKESELETIQDCTTEFYWKNETKTSCTEYWNEKNNSFSENCIYNQVDLILNKTNCKLMFYKYADEIYDASKWCCYDELCGLRKDYDCNYINEQRKQIGHSFKELNTGIVKIDSVELEKEYIIEKPELKATDISSLTIK